MITWVAARVVRVKRVVCLCRVVRVNAVVLFLLLERILMVGRVFRVSGRVGMVGTAVSAVKVRRI